MRTLLFLGAIGVSVAVSTALAQSSSPCSPGIPIPTSTLRGETRLDQPYTIDGKRIEVYPNTIVYTMGYEFKLIAVCGLEIHDTLRILSFPPPEPKPGKPDPAAGGRSYDRGPETEGCGVACRGADGKSGKAGKPGLPGNDGDNAGLVTVVVNGKSSGRLVIANAGGDGQDGGNGGDGGPGGDGQQGGRARPERKFGVVVGCASGPGYGGNGGPGGIGGPGGDAGDGGNGGAVVVQLAGDYTMLKVEASAAAGKAGAVGKGGTSGRPGAFGWGGRGATGCEGREEERKGSSPARLPNAKDGVPANKKPVDGTVAIENVTN